MKKRISKFISGILVFSLLMFSIPFVANGTYEVDGFTYRFANGGVVITDCQDVKAEKIVIPEKAKINGLGFKVVGVDDYAFGYCENLSVIYVPSTLKIDSMGNVAFLTSRSIVDFMNDELGPNATTEDVVRYVAKKINYNNGNFTDDDLDEVSRKLQSKLDKVDISVATTLEGKIMTFIKNIDQMELSSATMMKFNLWISGVRYSNLTIKGEDKTEIQQYAEGRSFLGLRYEVSSIYKLDNKGSELYYTPIDSDGDGENDSIVITGYSGNVQRIKIPDRIIGLPVMKIADYAFTDAGMLNSIIIPKSVEEIGTNAIGYFSDGKLVTGFTIYGYITSQALSYAIRNGINFVDLETVPMISELYIELEEGETANLYVENYEGEINWISNDLEVVVVEDGLVTAVGSGDTVIYAIAGGTILECNVTVNSKAVVTTVSSITSVSQVTSSDISNVTSSSGVTLPTGVSTPKNTTVSNTNVSSMTGTSTSGSVVSPVSGVTGVTSYSSAVSGVTVSSVSTVSSSSVSYVTSGSITVQKTTYDPYVTTVSDTTATALTSEQPVMTRIAVVGDANDDGKVDVRDAAFIAKMLAIGQSENIPFYADFNGDKKINVRDAAMIARALASQDGKHWVTIIIKVGTVLR